MKSLVLVSACVCLALPAQAQQQPQQPSPVVLKQIAPSSPTGDKLEVRVASNTLQPGFVGQWHTHPTPPVVYVVEGTLTVEVREKDPIETKAGSATIEPINTVIRATNKGQTPTRIVIFQMSPPELPDAQPAQ